MLQKKDEIQVFLEDKHRGFFQNLPNLKYGYPMEALDKILQADVPVALVAEAAVPEELKLLQELRENVCVIAINESWKKLLANGITPDFLMGDCLGDFDERLNRVAVISSVETENSLLEHHPWKQFFYWTENTLVQYMCMECAKRPGYPDTYSVMNPMPRTANVYERAVYVADYMNASKIIMFGIETAVAEKLSHSKLIRADVKDSAKIDTIRGLCHIKCYVQDTIEALLPLFNEWEKRAFDALIKRICSEIEATLCYIEKNIELYQSLYDIAVKEVVYQEELDGIISGINELTGEISRNGINAYVTDLADKMTESFGKKVTDVFQNELADVAVRNVDLHEKMWNIYQFLVEKFAVVNVNRQEIQDKKINVKRKKEILLGYGRSQYEVLPNIMQEIKRELQNAGYRVYVWRGNYKKWGYNLYQTTVGYDYIILMAGVFLDSVCVNPQTGYTQLWYDNPRTQVAAIFGDHPRLVAERLGYLKGGMKIFYMDKYWCQYIEKYMPQVSKPCYLQTAGNKQANTPDFSEKENKLVFFGTKMSDEVPRAINESPYRNIIWRIIEELKQHPNDTVEEVIRKLGKEEHCSNSLADQMLNADILIWAERYIRGYFREKIVTEIAKSGIPIEIYGWQSEEIAQYENVTLKDKVGFEEMLKICQNARFVLNVQAWAKDATHERVFNAALGGSVVVTDISDAIERQYKDEESMLFYRLQEIEKLPDKLKYYMEHPKAAEEIARRGYEITYAGHTWEHRAKEMMDMLERD